MPTRDNVAQLESLLEATMALIEVKRVVDKVDYDIQVLRSRLGMKVDPEGEDTQGIGMDVDESTAGGETGEDGRAQSVASARSARGSRKQVRLFQRPVSCPLIDPHRTSPVDRCQLLQ